MAPVSLCSNDTLCSEPQAASDELTSTLDDPQKIALFIMLTLFSVVGMVGNAIAFYIFFARRNSGTSVIFILALAGTDFITCLVTVPYTIVFEAIGYYFSYDVLCKLYMFLITSTVPYSSFIMAAIAFDRYFCICHPFLHVFNVQRARTVVLCLVIPAFTFGVITAMSHGMYIIRDFALSNNSVLIGTNLSVAHVNTSDLKTVDIANTTLLQGGFTLYRDVDIEHMPVPNTYRLLIYRQLDFNTECVLNDLYFGGTFQKWYVYVYSSTFLVCFITVAVLYILIYKSIFTRRAIKAKRKRKNHYISVSSSEKALRQKQDTVETAMTELNGNGSVSPQSGVASTQKNGVETPSASEGVRTEGDCAATRIPKKRPSCVRDRNLVANIKTAMMLFVVTLVFIVAFAPSWLMAHKLITFQILVFYFYFVYNVVNPFIYAFMNQAFREDLKKLLKRS